MTALSKILVTNLPRLRLEIYYQQYIESSHLQSMDFNKLTIPLEYNHEQYPFHTIPFNRVQHPNLSVMFRSRCLKCATRSVWMTHTHYSTHIAKFLVGADIPEAAMIQRIDDVGDKIIWSCWCAFMRIKHYLNGRTNNARWGYLFQPLWKRLENFHSGRRS